VPYQAAIAVVRFGAAHSLARFQGNKPSLQNGRRLRIRELHHPATTA
jgi:hypothetical protein